MDQLRPQLEEDIFSSGNRVILKDRAPKQDVATTRPQLAIDIGESALAQAAAVETIDIE